MITPKMPSTFLAGKKMNSAENDPPKATSAGHVHEVGQLAVHHDRGGDEAEAEQGADDRAGVHGRSLSIHEDTHTLYRCPPLKHLTGAGTKRLTTETQRHREDKE